MRLVVSIRDEELVYLDNILDPAGRREIDLALKGDENLQRRRTALVIDKSAIKAAFDVVAATAPVQTMRQRLDGGRKPPPKGAASF